MTVLNTIIADAYRESGILALNDTPDADEMAEGLRRLQVLVKSFLGSELGENLNEMNYGGGFSTTHGQYADTQEVRQWYVPKNTRVFLNVSAADTIYLDPNPRDGSRVAVIDQGGNLASNNVTLNANGRKIETTNTVVLSTSSVVREWFYRSDLGGWQRVTDLVAVDESPFPLEFDDFLVTMLAMRINPRFGAEMSPSSVAMLDRSRAQFRARYRQKTEVSVELGLQIFPNGCSFYPLYGDNVRFMIGR